MEEKKFTDLTVFDEPNGQGAITVALKGEVTSVNLSDLESYFGERDFAGTSELVLDFKDLTFMASVGLGFVVRLQKRIDSQDGKMQIINSKPIIRKILRLTRLDQHLEIVDSPE